MEALEKFIENIRKYHLFHPADKLLLAVSGGIDSVALCELCHQAGFSFEIAHVNFCLRGEESEGDEKFVRSLGEKYNTQVHVKRFNTEEYAAQNKASIQVAARELRYGWFRELVKEGFRCVLTAHHQADNIETVVMNFFRGTGITGLRGMMAKNEEIVRPLLPFTKEEILLFANKYQLHWREDSSNASDKYSRNYFRQTIIPAVKKIFPEAEQNIAANIERFRDIEQLYYQAIEHHKKRLLETKGKEVHIPVLKLKKTGPLATVIYEIVKSYHFSPHQVGEIVNLLDGEQGKYVQSLTHRIIKNRNWLIIADNEPLHADVIVIEEEEKQVVFSGGQIEIRREKISGIPTGKNIACLDAKEVKYPLILRKWKQGDYFYPLGMDKKKKIARFLIDMKLSPTEKENVWVIESAKRICWIAGLRIDDRFKINGNTRDVVRLSLEPR